MIATAVAIQLLSPAPFPFWTETFSIFLGDVLATIFLGFAAGLLWYVLKYPGFRVGANWSYTGWDMTTMKRLPNASDIETMELMPNISVTTRDPEVKKIVAAIWVRERADIFDPGIIHGVSHLHQTGMPADTRTTGGDPLNLPGPVIKCKASDFTKIFNCPIFIQTSDGEFFQAQSPGNLLKGIAKLRYRVQDAFHFAKQRLLNKLR